MPRINLKYFALLATSCYGQPHYIPINIDEQGRCSVEVSVDRGAHEITSGLSLSSLATISFSGSRFGQTSPNLSVLTSDPISPRYNFVLPNVFITGSSRDASDIGIGWGSNLLAANGAIAVTKNPNGVNHMVLGSTLESFIGTCTEGSFSSFNLTRNLLGGGDVESAHIWFNRTEDPMTVGPVGMRIGNEGFGTFVTLPRHMGNLITDELTRRGASRPSSGILDGFRTMRNCTEDMLSDLPTLKMQLGTETDGTGIDLFPQDYVTVRDNTCLLRFYVPSWDADRYPGPYFFDPLMVPNMNVRISQEGEMHICDSALE